LCYNFRSLPRAIGKAFGENELYWTIAFFRAGVAITGGNLSLLPAMLDQINSSAVQIDLLDLRLLYVLLRLLLK
jgi:hypothetical protein